jgi:hypothetical protein
VDEILDMLNTTTGMMELVRGRQQQEHQLCLASAPPCSTAHAPPRASTAPLTPWMHLPSPTARGASGRAAALPVGLEEGGCGGGGGCGDGTRPARHVRVRADEVGMARAAHTPTDRRGPTDEDEVQQHIGCYASEEDAGRAYDCAAVQAHGPGAKRNFPGEAIIEAPETVGKQKKQRSSSRYIGVSWDKRGSSSRASFTRGRVIFRTQARPVATAVVSAPADPVEPRLHLLQPRAAPPSQ